MAEATNSTVAAYLTAFALGVETAHRLGRALGRAHYERGWHATGTAGASGAATAAARLRNLDADQLHTACAAAASMASGMTRNLGTDLRPLHAGFAAQSGIFAAWLAREGGTADQSIWSGDRGVVDLCGGEREPVHGEAGWALLPPGFSIRHWPRCFASHRAIAGLETIVAERELTAEDVERIDVTFLPGADLAPIHEQPSTGLVAPCSAEYPLAARLLDGRLDTGSSADDAVGRPIAQDLMRRVRRIRLGGDRIYTGSADAGTTDVPIVASGQAHGVRTDRVPGSSQWPLHDEALAEMAIGCLTGHPEGRGSGARWLRRARRLGPGACGLNTPASQHHVAHPRTRTLPQVDRLVPHPAGPLPLGDQRSLGITFWTEAVQVPHALPHTLVGSSGSGLLRGGTQPIGACRSPL